VDTSIELSMEPSQEAPTLARAALHAAYADSMPAVVLQDLKIIVSELVGNSSRYAPEGPIRLSVEPHGEVELEGEVEDAGHEPFGMVEIRDDGGLGLHIVDALAQDWAVAKEGGSVRFTLAGQAVQ
jgi:anti-sigma regulatory factor (Ser/Thr protein kinase)